MFALQPARPRAKERLSSPSPFAPFFLRLALHRRRRRVLHLEPVRRAAGRLLIVMNPIIGDFYRVFVQRSLQNEPNLWSISRDAIGISSCYRGAARRDLQTGRPLGGRLTDVVRKPSRSPAALPPSTTVGSSGILRRRPPSRPIWHCARAAPGPRPSCTGRSFSYAEVTLNIRLNYKLPCRLAVPFGSFCSSCRTQILRARISKHLQACILSDP
jgi:hypothetical protein